MARFSAQDHISSGEPNVFISYVREDRGQVSRLVNDLRSAGISVWWDKDGLLAGDHWKEVIRAKIAEGDFFVACFSERYWGRGESYVNEELAVAIERMRLQAERKWFMPVRFDDCRIPEFEVRPGDRLTNYHATDLWPDWNDGLDNLIRSILPEGPLPPPVRAELIRLEDSSPAVRQAAARALGELQDPRTVSHLIRHLGDQHEDVKWAVVEALGRIGAPAVERLLRSLTEGTEEVRWGAAEALTRIEDPRAVELLTKALEGPQVVLHQTAAKALGHIKDVRALGPLIRALTYEDPRVREAAACALMDIRDAQAVGSLNVALRDQDVRVRIAVARALRLIGDTTSVEPLIEALADSETLVRSIAVYGLWRIGDKRGLEAVDKAIGKGLLPKPYGYD